MNLLVVGGSGFIGSWVVKAANKKGHRVTVLDINGNSLGVDTIIKDITDRDMADQDFRKYDIVILEAAITSNVEFLRDPVRCFKVNCIGLVNVLEACRKSNVKRVVFISSSSVYGDTTGASREDEIIKDTGNMYATSKIVGERIFNSYVANGYIKGPVIRYFNVYGVGENDKGDYKSIISLFLEAIKRDGGVKVYGDGSQRRDFIHVTDAAEITLRLAEEYDGLFNVGTGSPISWNEILAIFKKKGLKFGVENVPNPLKSYQLFTRADIKKIKSLGLAPKMPMEKGMDELIEFYGL